MSAVVLIPAYRPGPKFAEFISELIALGIDRIVVVDDGSGAAYRPLFDQAARHPRVCLCRHGINLGKGAALKTGINAVLCDHDGVTCVVTADADGQHHPEDVVAVARFAGQHPGALVLGARTFSGQVPVRSRLGNRATRMVMRLAVGHKLTDTQTGLRAIPYSLLPSLMKLAPRGYEFELDMLLLCRSRRVPIVELPIRTIYADGNASSHFNPLLDSMRIYFVLLRFTMVSMCTAVMDNVLFSLLFLSTGSILGSQVGARLAAMLFNFVAVKRLVFNSHGRGLREFLEYAALVALSGAMSFGLISLFVGYLAMGVLRAKLLAEGILFLGNFLVQRDIIFTGGEEHTSVLQPGSAERPSALAATEVEPGAR